MCYVSTFVQHTTKNYPVTLPSILLVDDHEIVFQGLKLILKTSSFKANISYCVNGDDCLRILRKQPYDLVILDINLPDTHVQNLLANLLREFGNIKILIFSTNPEELYAKPFLKIGAAGFVSKSAPSEEIVLAISQILSGKNYFSAALKEQLATDAIFGTKGNTFESLSGRELEVVNYLIQGLSNKEICNIMNLHSATIGTYKSKIFTKLNVDNVIALKELATLHGFE